MRNLRPGADSLRLVKDADEIARMRRAVDISVLGHIAAMQAARPGAWEYEIEAALEAAFRRHGADRVGYPSIVGGGPTAPPPLRCQPAPDRTAICGGGRGRGVGTVHGRRDAHVPRERKIHAAPEGIYELVLATQQAAFDSTRPARPSGSSTDRARLHARAFRHAVRAETCDTYFIHGCRTGWAWTCTT